MSLVESAKNENRETQEFIFQEKLQEKRVHEIQDMLFTVAGNLEDLQYFKGKDIHEFYHKKRAAHQEFVVETQETNRQMKHAPPVFSALEQKRQTLIRQKKLAKKSKPVDTYIIL